MVQLVLVEFGCERLYFRLCVRFSLALCVFILRLRKDCCLSWVVFFLWRRAKFQENWWNLAMFLKTVALN